VFTAFCESHTSQISFHVVARLLRAATGIKGLDPHAARAQVYAQVRDADPEDLALFDDLMGIADPDVKLPKIDPDARRRRLTALVNAVSVDITVRSASIDSLTSSIQCASSITQSARPSRRRLRRRSPGDLEASVLLAGVCELHIAGVHCCTDTGHHVL
jgi:hypothetical protein